MARGLAARGFSTPTILAEDLDRGVLLLEDLGTAGIVDEGGPIAERYGVAMDVLAALHAMAATAALPVAAGLDHVIPPFDLPATRDRGRAPVDWYLPHIGSPPLSQRNRDGFFALWRGAFAPILRGRRPGSCATSTRPTSSGCQSAPASPASAFSTSRTP